MATEGKKKSYRRGVKRGPDKKKAASQRTAQQSPSVQAKLSSEVSTDGGHTVAANPVTSPPDAAVSQRVNRPFQPVAATPSPQFFLARPGTAGHPGPLVPLIPLDQLPNWLDVVGVPRTLSAEQASVMTSVGEVRKTSALAYEVRRVPDAPKASTPIHVAAAPAAGPQHPGGEMEGGGRVLSGGSSRLPQTPGSRNGDAASSTVVRRDMEQIEQQQNDKRLDRPQSKHPEDDNPSQKAKTEPAKKRSPKDMVPARHHTSSPPAPSDARDVQPSDSGPEGATGTSDSSGSSTPDRGRTRSLEKSMHATPKAEAMPLHPRLASPEPGPATGPPNPYAAVLSYYNPRAPQQYQPQQRQHQHQRQPQQEARHQAQHQPQQEAQHQAQRPQKPQQTQKPRKPPACKSWCQRGNCKFGNNCPNKHEMPKTAQGLKSVGLDELPKWYHEFTGRTRPYPDNKPAKAARRMPKGKKRVTGGGGQGAGRTVQQTTECWLDIDIPEKEQENLIDL